MVTKTDPSAKPRERLTRERVIDAALGVMDSEGLEAVSMRRVAREVGVEAMSLYNHVRDKEDLLAGIQQRVFSEFAFDADPDDPYGNGVRVAHAWRDLMRTHPALIEIMAEKHQAPDLDRGPPPHGEGPRGAAQHGRARRRRDAGVPRVRRLHPWAS